MKRELFMEEIANDFIYYVSGSRYDEPDLDFYFGEWLTSDSGFEDVACDQNMALRVYLIAVMRFQEDPDLFGERKTPITCLRSGPDSIPWFMEPDYWRMYVCRYLYGDRRPERSHLPGS